MYAGRVHSDLVTLELRRFGERIAGRGAAVGNDQEPLLAAAGKGQTGVAQGLGQRSVAAALDADRARRDPTAATGSGSLGLVDPPADRFPALGADRCRLIGQHQQLDAVRRPRQPDLGVEEPCGHGAEERQAGDEHRAHAPSPPGQVRARGGQDRMQAGKDQHEGRSDVDRR